MHLKIKDRKNVKIYIFKQDHTVVTIHFLLLCEGEEEGKEVPGGWRRYEEGRREEEEEQDEVTEDEEEEARSFFSVVFDSRLSLVVPWSIEFCLISFALEKSKFLCQKSRRLTIDCSWP